MTLSYTYDGSAITHDIAPSAINIPTRADMGEAAFGGIPIEDPDKTLAIVGHKPFIVEESACSQPRLYTGWTTQRDIGRSEEDGLLVGPDPSLTDMTVADLNILFGMRIIRGGGTGNGNRPSETWNERLAWILADSTLDGLIEITNADWVISRNLIMDEADYRGQPPSAVFDDLLQRPPIRQLTYFAVWDPAEEAVGLFFHELSEATNDSTLSISNDLDDVNGTTCFAPWMDTTLARKPDQVYSEVLVEWPGGRTFRHRQSTEDEFGRRGTQISRPYCKSQTRAQEYAEAFLDRHDSEEDVITTQILVPKASAGLVMAGQRISCKFTHLDGYEDWTSLRVTECRPTPATDIGDLYLISLELVAPRLGTAPEPEPEDVDCLAGSDISLSDDRNIAKGKTVTMSSSSSRTYSGAEYVTDGLSTSAEFNLAIPGGTYYDLVRVDLGATTDVDVITVLMMRTSGLLMDPTQFTVLVSDSTDGSTGSTPHTRTDGWRNVWELLPPWTEEKTYTFVLDEQTSGRYVYLRREWSLPYFDLSWAIGEIAICGSTVTSDDAEDVGVEVGTIVPNASTTPDPDGSEDTFYTPTSYFAGNDSLRVFVDGIAIPDALVTQTDPSEGAFTLAWAPDPDETITVSYMAG